MKRTLIQALVRLVPLLFLLMLGFYLLSINLRQPWVSVHEDNGLVFMSSAVNNIRYGLGYTKGETVVDRETLNNYSPLSPRGVATTDEFHYLLTGPTHPYIYPNHPPLLSLTVTASLLTFGYHFWAVRLVPLAYSLGAIAVFYFLVGYVFDDGIAFFSTFLLATFPMMAYFGRNVAFEAEVVFWLLVMLTGYAHWEKTGRSAWLALSGIAVFIGLLYDWPMFFFAFILFAVDALSKRRISLPLASATVLPALAGMFVAFGQVYLTMNHSLKPLVTIFLIRSGNTGFGHAPVSIITWFNQVVVWNTEGYGLWSQIVLPFAILFVVSRASQEGASLRVRFVLITVLCGLAHVLVFREGAIIHAYWQQYFLPFYAITIGWAAVELVRHVVSAAQLRWIPLLTAAVIILAFNIPTIVSLYSSLSGVFVPILYLWK